MIDSEEDENISNADSDDEPKESIINNEPKQSIIYDLLKKVGSILEESTVNNNEELMNNALKTINTLAKVISLKEQSKIVNNFEELNKINNTNTIEKIEKTNTLREQSNNRGTYVELLKCLKTLKYIFNPINNNKRNNKCFQYSIALSKYKEIGTNYNRINKIEPYL